MAVFMLEARSLMAKTKPYNTIIVRGIARGNAWIKRTAVQGYYISQRHLGANNAEALQMWPKSNYDKSKYIIDCCEWHQNNWTELEATYIC